MDEHQLQELFFRAAGGDTELPGEVKQIFSILVSSTLRYRDQLKEADGTVLTVEDVRTALDGLMETMKTGILPGADQKTTRDLVKNWLRELQNPKSS